MKLFFKKSYDPGKKSLYFHKLDHKTFVYQSGAFLIWTHLSNSSLGHQQELPVAIVQSGPIWKEMMS